jgi:hypothetical protein
MTGYRAFEVTDMGANAVGAAWLGASPPRGPNVIIFVERVLSSFSTPTD